MYARTVGDGPVRALSRCGQAKWNEKQPATHEKFNCTPPISSALLCTNTVFDERGKSEVRWQVNNQFQPKDLAARGNGLVSNDDYVIGAHVCVFHEIRDGGLTLLKNLLRQVVLVADFLDLMKLTFDPIDMLLLVDDNMF